MNCKNFRRTRARYRTSRGAIRPAPYLNSGDAAGAIESRYRPNRLSLLGDRGIDAASNTCAGTFAFD